MRVLSVPLPWVAGIALALVASLSVNGWQLYRAGKASAATAHALEKCDLVGQLAGLERVIGQGQDIAAGREEDRAELLAELETIVDRGRKVRVEYRTAAAAAPLPVGCQPGEDRVNAVNDFLGPRSER